METNDRVEVKVLAARGLPRCAGGTTNPCVRVSCAGETSFTKTMSRDPNPDWEKQEGFQSMIFSRITENEERYVVCEVLHKNTASGKFEVIGVVPVNLANAMLSPGIHVDEWVPLAKVGGSGGDDEAGSDIGELRVRVVYFIDDAFGDLFDDDDDDAGAPKTPNCLSVTVSKARNLRAADNSGNCNPYVSIGVGNESRSTPVVKGSTSPKFDAGLTMPVTNGNKFITVRVRHRGAIGSKFLGSCKIPMVDVAGGGPLGIQRWFRLLGDNGTFDEGSGRGEVELILAWVYDKRYRPFFSLGLGLPSIKLPGMSLPKFGGKKKGGSSGGGGDDGDDDAGEQKMDEMDEDDDDIVPLSAQEQAALDKLRGDRLEAATEQMERYELQTSNLKHGDYQVQVHIIEAQDLKAEGYGGTSNPVVRVKMLGEYQRTSCVKGVNSCIFNEKLFFNFKDLEPTQLVENDVTLQVVSRNLMGLSNPSIGTFSLNLLQVYGQKDHEYYKQWVALTDPHDKDDNGIQGYLQISVTVIGPGDAQKFHDLDKEYQQQKEADRNPDAVQDAEIPLTPAEITQELQFLVVSVFEAQDMPMMDRFTRGGLSGSGIDAYVQASFAGNPALRTPWVHCGGTKNLNAEFMTQLWIPVQVPTMSDRIALSLWDRDFHFFSSNKLVAHSYFSYKDLPKLEQPRGGGGLFGGLFSKNEYDGPPPKWVNLYGAATDLRGRAAGKMENTYPDIASTYRGRLLVAMHVYYNPKKSEPEFIHKKSLPGIDAALYPKMQRYNFRVSMLLGSELPQFKVAAVPKSPHMSLRVVVELGPHRFVFSAQKVSRGKATWIETQEVKDIELPYSVAQMPDVGVYLCLATAPSGPLPVAAAGAGMQSSSSYTTISYARMPAAKFLTEAFQGEPFWQKLQPDKSREQMNKAHFFTRGLRDNMYPGALLMRVGLGIGEDGRENKWRDVTSEVKDTQPYCLRVHVFQGRDIPSSDPNGLLDPYVKCWFGGVKKKTTTKHETNCPLYYETLEFNEEMPKNLKFAPELVMQVWDSDGGSGANNSKVAVCRYDLSQIYRPKKKMGPPSQPVWLKLEDIHGQPTAGGLLVSVQLVIKRDITDKEEEPESLVPPMKQAFLEVTALGVRDIQMYNNRHIHTPEVRFDIPNLEDGYTFYTKRAKAVPGSFKGKSIFPGGAKSTNGSDANFMLQQVVPIVVAENAKYAPSLMMRCYDTRGIFGTDVGILQEGRPMVGATSVSLQQFLPWNSEGYKAPQSQLYDPFNLDNQDNAQAPKDADEDAGKHDADYFPDEPEYISDDELKAEEKEEASQWMKDVRSEEARAAEMKSEAADAGSGDDGDGGGNEDTEDDGDTGAGAFKLVDTEDIFFPEVVPDGTDPLELLESGGARGKKQDGGEAGFGFGFADAKAAAKAAAAERMKELKGEELDADDLKISFPQTWADAKYRTGRDWWMENHHGKELENYLETMPFEHYALYLGKYHPNPEKSRRKVVGFLKGMIRVTETDPREEGAPLIDMDVVQQKDQTDYKVRVYIVKGRNLQPVGGGLSDPYVRIRLGKQYINDMENHQVSTTDPDFFQAYELDALIPGQSTLQIELRDYQRTLMGKEVYTHQLIGQTTIDLEDRWFHKKWQALGVNRNAEGYLSEYDGFRSQLKPLEMRNLTKPGDTLVQGQIEMWLEICPKRDASMIKMEKLAGPPEKKFELRIVCWKAEGVPKKSGTDLYSKFKLALPEAGKAKSTDIHLRCKDGNPAWNYRIKFNVTLPLKDPLDARLAIQLWDFNVLSSDELIAERNFDLYGWFMKAYHEEGEVQPFKIMHAKKAAMAEEAGEDPDGGGLGGEKEGEKILGEKDRLPLLGQTDYATAAVDVIDGDLEDFAGESGSVAVAAPEGEEDALLGGDEEVDSSEEEDEEEDDDEAAKREQALEAKNSFLSLLGMGRLADDAMWMNMTTYDMKRKKMKNKGRLAFSISILPMEDVESRPAGHGRSDPNDNPYLPPPPGRMSFSFNPLSMLFVLFTPEILCCICCCLCILILLAVMLYGGSYYVTYVTLMDNIRR